MCELHHIESDRDAQHLQCSPLEEFTSLSVANVDFQFYYLAYIKQLETSHYHLVPPPPSSFLSLFSGTKANQFRQFYVRFKSTLSPGRSQLTRFTSHIVSPSLPLLCLCPSSLSLSSLFPSSLVPSSLVPPLSPPLPSLPLVPYPSSLPQLFIAWITQLKYSSPHCLNR